MVAQKAPTSVSISIQTVWMPATADRPAEPAPYLLTEEEVIRLMRIQSKAPYQVLYRYRQQGLRATQSGNHVRYLLTDVVAFLEEQKGRNPR